MTGILSRLFTYRERPDAAPLENFLTEAFAAFYERLEPSMQRALLLKLLPPASLPVFNDCFADSKIAISTQSSLTNAASGKRPDLLVYVAGRCVIAIEVKIGARFQQHDLPIDVAKRGSTSVSRGQLETYAEWINIENNDNEYRWPGALVLLTAWTDAPHDFVDGRPDGVFRSTRTWKNVGDWILSNISVKKDAQSVLASELYMFLKEQNLMSRYATARDLNIAALFAPASAPLKKTFRDVTEHIARHFPKLSAGRRIKVEFWDEGSIFSGYFFFARSLKRPKSKPYLSIGICFEVDDFWASEQAALPLHEPFFVIECSDEWEEESPQEFLEGIPAGWIEIKEGMRLVRVLPVRSLSADPDERVEALKEWAIREVDCLVACIPGYSEAPVGTLAKGDDSED